MLKKRRDSWRNIEIIQVPIPYDANVMFPSFPEKLGSSLLNTEFHNTTIN